MHCISIRECHPGGSLSKMYGVAMGNAYAAHFSTPLDENKIAADEMYSCYLSKWNEHQTKLCIERHSSTFIDMKWTPDRIGVDRWDAFLTPIIEMKWTITRQNCSRRNAFCHSSAWNEHQTKMEQMRCIFNANHQNEMNNHRQICSRWVAFLTPYRSTWNEQSPEKIASHLMHFWRHSTK